MIVRISDLSAYLISEHASLREAVGKIDLNKKRTCFIVGEGGLLLASLSDGDVRRYLLKGGELADPAMAAANSNFVSLPERASRQDIHSRMSHKVSVVPLIDARGAIRRIAFDGPPQVMVGGRAIGRGHPCFIIAEIGNNHNGSIETAKKLVDIAKDCGVDCVKFQLRHMDSVYRQSSLGKSGEDLGTQYTLDLLDKFQLTVDQMREMAEYVRSKELIFLCTPWDPLSVDALESMGVEAYKVASADFTNIDLLRYIGQKKKTMLLSTGMTTSHEIDRVVGELESLVVDFVLLHTNSTYPAPAKDVHLNFMKFLSRYEVPIGYSGHERGIAISVAAVALGATVIERHITLDRGMEGVDHKASLLPDEFRALVDGIRQVEQACGKEVQYRQLSQGEMMNRENLGKSIVAARAIKAGEIITEGMLTVRSPGRGISPLRKQELVGRPARRDIALEDFFYESDISEAAGKPRSYSLRRKWGLVVRYHDLERLIDMGKPHFVEFHFSYRDIDEHVEKQIAGTYDMDFVVHAPELFQNDHLLDLCSADETYRRQSVNYLQSVIDLTRKLSPRFKKAEKPRVVVHCGGFTVNSPLSADQRPFYYERLIKSLREVDAEGVEVLPENMPPYPWLFGGQRYQNILVLPDEIERFCNESGLRICFDCSHSKLTCNKFGIDHGEFAKRVAPFSAHMHVADARGVDGEGLQIGAGENDFAHIASVMDRYSPHATLIPEIWQGHKNSGEGFWIALDRLEKWF